MPDESLALWQQKVIELRENLQEEIKFLIEFKRTSPYAELEENKKDLIEIQLKCMRVYESILHARVDDFKTVYTGNGDEFPIVDSIFS